MSQAVDFLRLHEPRLILLHMALMKQNPANFFANLDEVESYYFSLNNIASIINFFEDDRKMLEAAYASFYLYMKRGATFEDFNELIKSFVKSFEADIRSLLPDEPELAEQIIERFAQQRRVYVKTFGDVVAKLDPTETNKPPEINQQ